MRASERFAAAAAVAGLLAACGGQNFVRVDDVALGRVVVYRSGVAFYQRRATLTGDQLTVTVPRDKVDDFLKSLTVRDARSGALLPVAFPRDPVEQAANGYANVVMTIQLPTRGPTDLVLTYITEAPAWKPSYRLMVRDGGKVDLEGWAIVDNTSGEDWRDVLIGVGSSSALSFRYDLWNVRMVQRETLATEERFAMAPPRGVSPYREHGKTTVVVGELEDKEIARHEAHPENVYVIAEKAPTIDLGATSQGVTVGDTYTRNVPVPARTYDSAAASTGATKVKQVAQQLRGSASTVVIEGYASSGEANGNERALDRANMIRNQLIDEGVPPAQLKVRALGVTEGRAAGVRLVVDDTPPPPPQGGEGQPAATPATLESDDPVGESHFDSKTPMTIERGTSAMVSIVKQPTQGEVVYLYDAESERGNSRFAFRAVRFRNPSRSTLEAGPVTVYGSERFIGEGLTEPIPPEATAVVPFALDRQVVIEREGSFRDEIDSLVTVQRGIATASVRHIRRTALKVTNRMSRPVKLFVRHTVPRGWQLGKSPTLFERHGEAHLFEVALAAGETEVVAIEEVTPIEKTIDLAAPAGIDMVRVYLSSPDSDARFAEQMAKLLAVHTEVADIQHGIDSLRERLADYRTRMDELHAQIVTLKAVKQGGQLMRHLELKLADVSERVQGATIELVDRQEKLMLARIRFQDGVAELSLERAVAAKD